MGLSLRHRGPDDEGSVVFPRAGLHNRRLSIIDVAGGHQPFRSADGEVAVVQNGEIFNFVELTRDLAAGGIHCCSSSDTEVLLHLYMRDGIDFVSRLNGMFAIAIYDQRIDTLFVIRDRLGVKPLYIAQHADRFLFASEIKALFAAGVPAIPDEESLHYMLTLNYVPPPLTAFRGVRHLPPGSFMQVAPCGTSVRQWWSLAERATRSVTDSRAELVDLLTDSVRIRLRADVPVGAFLSGGIDSSTIVGLTSRIHNSAINTFAIGFEDPTYDESAHAAHAARRFGTHHVMERVSSEILELWPAVTFFNDQPHGDVSFIPTYRLAGLAARSVKVVLTGDGGDELFAGYTKYADFFARPDVASLSAVEFARAYVESTSLFTSDSRDQLYSDDFKKRMVSFDAANLVAAQLSGVQHFDRINQVLYLDCTMLLPGNNLVKPDRMGMANSLEARTPFLDYRLVEFAFDLPGIEKLRGSETKWILKKAVSDLIGGELLNRGKQMFTVPVGQWFREAFGERIRQLLLSKRTAARGLFKQSQIEKMVADHMRGTRNNTRQLRALIALELWFRTFIDRQFTSPPVWEELLA